MRIYLLINCFVFDSIFGTFGVGENTGADLSAYRKTSERAFFCLQSDNTYLNSLT